MWYRIGQFILKNKIVLLIVLGLVTIFMGWHASQVKFSYDFSKAIPEGNEKYKDYVAFKKQFGEDGNVVIIGVQSDHFFDLKHFQFYKKMLADLKNVKNIEAVFGLPSTINLIKTTAPKN